MATQGAMSSTSTGETKWNYDVFLSFTGEDTCHTFTGSLYRALCDKQIKTFIDGDQLRTGEQIATSLPEAIQKSRMSIIVFSEKYAASRWCLDALVKILECKKERNQLVWPIFYKVDPADVRHQRNSYGDAMTAHENRFGKDSEKVQKWRSALSYVSKLSGFHFKEGDELEFIEKIVSKVYIEVSSKEIYIREHLVGLESQVEQAKLLLDVESKKTSCMLGIYGTGGIGKTTLAKALFNSICNQFEAACFLSDVREKSNQFEGLENLQQTLLSDLIKGVKFGLANVEEGTKIIKTRLGKKRVLIVLDDVSKISQLEKLTGNRERDWFGSGSKIIITTRHKHLLDVYKVEKKYEMKVLNDDESLELFSWNAFNMNRPEMIYGELSNEVIRYAKGLPLALKVIGSYLIGKDLDYWKSALNDLKKSPHKDIQRILRISYDSLNYKEKATFLDIACFFKGRKEEFVKKILDACEFNPVVSIKNLFDKSLINIEYGSLRMHDLIQDMGREVVKQEPPKEAGVHACSRLWFREDVLEVLTKNTGSDKIEGIMLDPPQREEVNWIGTAFEKMKNLRILIVRNTRFSSAPNYLPNQLRLLDWEGYPSPSLPECFYPKKIVFFNLRGSPLELEKPFQKFDHLTYLNLSYCQSITEIPNVSGAINLGELKFDKCLKLEKVHQSVGFLPNLVYLSAWECTKLRSFLPRICLPSLEYLSLNLCRRLEHFPHIVGKMDKPLKIYMIDTAIKMLPHSFGNLAGLEYAEITGCTGLQDLPSSLFMLPNFVTLKIGGCSQLRESFGSFIGSRSVADQCHPSLETLHFDRAGLTDNDLHVIILSFPKLKDLNVSWNNFVYIPACIKESVYLTTLNVSYCTELQEIPELPLSTQKVDARHCKSLTSDSSSMLWSQVLHQMDGLEVMMPKTEIPEWFDHRDDEGGFPRFWARRKFPVVTLAFVFEEVNGMAKGPLPVHWQAVSLNLFIDGEHVHRQHYQSFTLAENHVLLCDLRVLFSDKEWQGLDALIGHDWKTVQVNCETDMTLTCWGVYVNKEETDTEYVQFTSPFSDSSGISFPSMLVPTISEEQKVRHGIEELNLPEIFRGYMLEGKYLEESGYYEDKPPSFLKSHVTLMGEMQRISRRLGTLEWDKGATSGSRLEEDDNEKDDFTLKWLLDVIKDNEKE